MANYNAAVQRNNAAVNQQMAVNQAQAQGNLYTQQQTAIRQQQAANLSQAKEAILRSETEKSALMAKQRAAYAGAGVIMQGSPLAVLSDTASKFQTAQSDTLYKSEVANHALNYEYNGADYRKSLLTLDVYGAKAGAANANAMANLTQLQGSADMQAGEYKAAGTLLSSAGSAAGSMYKAS
jgi:hypothetical protein